MNRSIAPLCVVLALAACSAPQVDRAGTRVDEAPEIRYHLTLETQPKLAVRFEVTAPGSSDGTTEFAMLEAWGGATQGGSEFVQPEASDEHGAPLQVERPAPYRFVVRHAPGAHVTLRYTLPETAPKTPFVQGGHFRPVLTPSLFHFIGDLALVAPLHLDAGPTRVIELAFDGFDAAGWHGATSFAPGFETVRVRRSLGAFCHCLVIAGDVEVDTHSIRGKPVTVAVQRNAFGFAPDEFADHARRIIDLQRVFFGDDDAPHFLVSVMDIGAHVPNGFSVGGTSLTQGFATFLPHDAAFRVENGFDQGSFVDLLLAHEMAHHWIGGLVSVEQPEPLHYWFTEGFAEFVGRRVIQQAGLCTRQQALDELNTTLAEYSANSQKNAPATRIAELFWTDANITDLPYQRGNLVAIAVDHAIRKRSAGKDCLDDLLRELVSDAKAKRLTVDTDDLLLRISAWAGADCANRMRKVVVDGETIALESDTFAPEWKLVEGDVPRFEMAGISAATP